MLWRLFVVCLCCVALPGMAVAAGPVTATSVEKQGVRVLFLPFETSAAGDYGYLADPVKNMLAARLAVRAGVVPVEGAEAAGLLDASGQIVPARLDALIGQYQADYLVVGSLTRSRESLGFQALVLALSGASSPQEFAAQADGGAGVMAAVDQLASEMSNRVFAPGLPASSAAREPSTRLAPPVFQTPHPDRAMKQGIYGVDSTLEGITGAVPQSLDVRRSGILPLTVQAMDVGDLDGDGLDEIVVASHGRLLLYQERDGIFRQQHESPLPAGLRVHGLTVADVDGDGRAAVYVSATDQEEPASLVLVWQDGNLHVRSSGLAWYLRPVAVPGEGVILLGQQAGMDSLLSPGVYRLSESESGLTGGPLLSLPQGVNLFDFIYADVTGDGAAETVAVDGNERILVYSLAGQLLWAGGEDYSGSSRFLGLPPVTYQSRGDDARADRELIYVQVRLAAVDLDNDGSMEILVARNKRMASKYMKRFRFYEGGHVVSLGWREGRMVELWRTAETGSQVVDLQQISGQAGGQRVYVAQIVEESLVSSLLSLGGKSRLTLFDLGRVVGAPVPPIE